MPPTASMISANPPKSISTTWSMRTPVNASTVWTSSGVPPFAYAELILSSCPSPAPVGSGTRTQVSRGIETIWTLSRSAGRWARMMVSVREPEVSGSRESLPTIRKFAAFSTALTGRCACGRAVKTSSLSTCDSTDRA